MKKNILTVLLLVIAAIIAVGSVTVLGPCSHPDGRAGCADAGDAILIDGCVLAVLALLAILIRKPGARIALFILAICASVVGFLLPGTLFPLCKMETMRCRTIMQPAMRILFSAGAISALIGIFAARNETRSGKA